MRFFKIIVFSLILMIFDLLIFAQPQLETDSGLNRRNDSLLAVLKTTKDDSTKIKTLHNLFILYEYSNKEKARIYLNNALELSLKNSNKNFLASTYIYLGYFDEDRGNYTDGLNHYLSSLKIYQAIKNKAGEANSLNCIGAVYFAQGNYPEALRNYFASLKLEEMLDDKLGVASSYNNIGIIYKKQQNYSEALKKYFLCLKVEQVLDNKKGIAASYNNIGNIYDAQGNYPEGVQPLIDVNYLPYLFILSQTCAHFPSL